MWSEPCFAIGRKHKKQRTCYSFKSCLSKTSHHNNWHLKYFLKKCGRSLLQAWHVHHLNQNIVCRTMSKSFTIEHSHLYAHNSRCSFVLLGKVVVRSASCNEVFQLSVHVKSLTVIILQGFGIRHVLNPDAYRGKFGNDGSAYAADVEDTIRFATPGRIAGFISESVQGVGGAVPLADGYLPQAYEVWICSLPGKKKQKTQRKSHIQDSVLLISPMLMLNSHWQDWVMLYLWLMAIFLKSMRFVFCLILKIRRLLPS